MQQIEAEPMNDEMFQMIEDTIKALTDDWVETMLDSRLTSFMWRMAAQDMLPEGVDTGDKRVIELCKKAKEYYLARRANK